MRLNGSHRGFALLIVLWSLGLLALLGTQVLVIRRQDTQLAHNTLDAAVLESAADAAVQLTVFDLLDPSPRHWIADGSTHVIRFQRAIVAVRIDSETDKINPSIASEQLLQALLLQVGADPATAAAVATSIAEWRLAGNTAGRVSPSIARYASAGRDLTPSGAPFASIDELGAVLGMTPDLLARLWPHLTVYSDVDPDRNTGDPVVARALAVAGEVNANSDRSGEEVVSVTADARGSTQGRFAARVVVRLNARPEGARYEVLARERV